MDVIKNYLIFGNIDNRDYGIEVFFNDVDHVPKRVYERIEVPGRNGAVLIDEGRYEDVPVTYDCVALNDIDRSEFVNALASQTGYQRMQDSFNNGEFYSAVFEGDVDPNVTSDREKSTFSIYFTRSAQRFLASGEEAIDVSSGDVILNPTLFESSPMLEVEGYGTIGFNGYEIDIENGTLGEVTLWDRYANAVENSSINKTVSIPSGLLNNGDTFFINGYTINGYNGVNAHVAGDAASITSYTHSGVSDVAISCRAELGTQTSPFGNYYAHFWINVRFPSLQFEVGTPLSYVDQEHVYYTYTFYSSTASGEIYIETSVEYDGDSTITFSERGLASSKALQYIEYAIPQGVGISSNPIMGHPTYIDCDLGEAYKIEDGAIVSLNQYIDLGSKLPTLASSSNEITYDNTITDLKLIPRWWKI